MTKNTQSHPPFRGPDTADKGRAVDVSWGRPVFKAPDIANPRLVFDPLPFRTQLFGSSRASAAR
jgi:hypothetical protein